MRAPELLSVWFALAGTAAALCGAAALLFGAPPPSPEPRMVRISFSPASAGTAACRTELASGLQDAAERPAGFEMPDCAGAHGASGRSGFAGGAAESVQLAERAEIPDGAERAPSAEIIPTADGGLPPAASVSASVPAAVPALAGVPAQAERIRARRTAGSGIRTDIAVGTRDADGLLSVRMADGSSRILLEPQKPVILISAEAAALIDGSRTVQIQLAIRADGSVPVEGIAAVPAALLPARVFAEAAAQISQWRFSPAAFDGRARFAYSIIKR